RERGNAAFKASQYGEALSAYSRAVDHFRGDKAIFANRALVHLKLRNFASAIEDTSRAIDIATYLDEDVLKAYVRRATAHAALGQFDEAEADLEQAREMAP
ncbi:protein phosphatase-5, partial [Emiliania huxleyi CCMP1516]|uniref:Uncharacterized protein n=2 Tax=Emiliania huxleyi TaxID=2903 RepID=A0A0D3K6Z1_EMIH1